VRALKRSCNHFCYEVGGRLGRDVLVDGLARLGVFDPVPGLAGTPHGLEALLRSASEDVRNLAIGQGSLDCAPVRAAGVAASLATGRVIRPHLHRPQGFDPVGPHWAGEGHLQIIREGMREVVLPGGTAAATRELEKLRFAGKTGTAQLRDDLEGSLFNSWFVGYTPWDDPRFAIAVVLDRTAKEGPEVAPIAARVAEIVGEEMGRWWVD
jgi:penicillin-binding protein 2